VVYRLLRKRQVMKHQLDDTSASTSTTTTAKPDPGRRRFVIGGIVAAPVLVSLAARPANANWNQQGYQGSYGSAI
jgi:hypothetical protein